MTAAEIVSRTRISEVWRALGGGDLRNGRGRAWWRGGDGYNVALHEANGCWYDYRDHVGGGVLDLVQHIRGGNRTDALRWTADLIGVALDDKPGVPRHDNADAVRIRRDAMYFATAARMLAEETLDSLPPEEPDRAVHTAMLAALGVSPEAEYRAWMATQPEWGAALVYAGRAHQQRIQTALARYFLAEVVDAPRV